MIAKIWKQPKCPLMDDCIKKMWYIYLLAYYSAIRKNEISSFATMWMDLEGIMLSEISQRRQIPYNLTCMWNLKTKAHGHRVQTGG